MEIHAGDHSISDLSTSECTEATIGEEKDTKFVSLEDILRIESELRRLAETLAPSEEKIVDDTDGQEGIEASMQMLANLKYPPPPTGIFPKKK